MDLWGRAARCEMREQSRRIRAGSATNEAVKSHRSTLCSRKVRRMPKVSEAYTAARRNEILETAHRLFAIDGFRKTQMRDIAKSAGISTGAIYRYFSSKEELARAVMERLHIHEDAHRSKVLGAGSAVERLQRLPAEFVRLAEFNEQNRRNFRDYGEAASIPLLAEGLGEMFEHTTRDLEALIREAQEDGDLRADLDVKATASVVATMGISVRFARLFGGSFDGPAMTKTLERMLQGLRSTDGPPEEAETRT